MTAVWMPWGPGVPGMGSTFGNGGRLTGRAMICAAGSFGIAISAKNWLCTAAQTTLFEPARYSERGAP